MFDVKCVTENWSKLLRLRDLWGELGGFVVREKQHLGGDLGAGGLPPKVNLN